MKYSSSSFSLLSLSIIALSLLWLALKEHPSSIGLALCLCLFFSVLVPAVVLAVRHEIWIARVRAAELFRKDFPPGPGINSHFEFVRSKYFYDPSDREAKPLKFNPEMRFPSSQDWLLLASSIPFIFLTASMTFILFLPSQELPQLLGGTLGASVLSVGGLSEAGPKDYENAITIASIAFAGAFLYCLRLFLRSLLAFDFNAATFLRTFIHALFAIMLAVVIGRTAPDIRSIDGAVSQSAMAQDRKAAAKDNHAAADASAAVKPQPVSKVMLLLAFAIGFLPDAGFAWMVGKARLILGGRSARLGRAAGQTPLTVIDGIDFMTAYRLNERKISNVQNLAAANPIMLQVEMPAGIYTIMDWVAQAQLCAALGPQRFFLLRRLNLRTIFDLERAVLDPAAPLGLKQMVGTVLLANDGKTSIFRNFGVRPLDVTYRDFDKAMTAWVNVEVIEHLVRLIMDDLHIKRFRQLWEDIGAALDNAKQDGSPRSPLKLGSHETAAKALVHANGYGHDGFTRPEVPFGVNPGREL